MRTTSGWWLLSMAEVFRRQQLPVKQIFKDAGISLTSLAHVDTRFPQDSVTRLWDSSERASGNDHIGLDVGRQISVSGFPVLGYSLVSAIGLADGFQRFQRYQSMIGESANIQLLMKDGQLALEFAFSGDELALSPHTLDAAMAAMVTMARVLEGQSWHPQRVELSRKSPKDPQVFKDYYGCEVSFSQSRNRMCLDAIALAAQLQQSSLIGDPSADIASFHGQDKPLAELVEMLIQPKLQDGSITKSQVATWLNLTPKTLQRRLAKEGETYQGIYERVRYRVAQEYLSNPQITQTEAAFLCGFSDITSFHHAFKRWHGDSPGRFQSQLFELSNNKK
ncbi:MAG: AraC family transcriptional regulator [Pseudomonadales bacterium]|nr:AraC family transcriptional regulator [Pseudomonadales bacterium]